jgi:hypothetical protein
LPINNILGTELNLGLSFELSGQES